MIRARIAKKNPGVKACASTKRILREEGRNVKHLGDITKIKGNEVSPVHIVVGGSPCQDLSVAGAQRGIRHSMAGDEETTRSGLFYEMIRIIKEMRENVRGTDVSFYGRYALWENVPGALSAPASDGGKGTAFQVVLTEFIRVTDEEAPLVPIPEKGWPGEGEIIFNDGRSSLAWRIIDAQYAGVPQRRRRIALLCDYDGLSAGPILFEQHFSSGCPFEIQPVTESVQRNPDEGGKARETTSGSSEKCTGADSGDGL